MKLLRSPRPISNWLLGPLVLLFFTSPLLSAQYEEGISTENSLYATGMIRSISLDNQTVTIKQKKGPAIVLSIDKNTLFEGFYKLQELKPRGTIKVWYQPGPQENMALKILKPLELGC